MTNRLPYLAFLAAGVIGLTSTNVEAGRPRNCPPVQKNHEERGICTIVEYHTNGQPRVKECLELLVPDVSGIKTTVRYDALGRVLQRESNLNPFGKKFPARDIPARLIGFYDPISGAEVRAEEYLDDGSLKAKITYDYDDKCRIREALWDYDGDGVPDEILHRTRNAQGEVIEDSYDTNNDGKPDIIWHYKKRPKTTPLQPGESDTIMEVDEDGDGVVDKVY